MKYLESTGLSAITEILGKESAGLINGRVECYSQKRSGIDKYSKEAKALVAKVAADASVASDKDGQLVFDLVQTLNASHNDHNFDSLSADSFMPVTGGVHEVMRDVNEHLAEITMTRPTFLSDLWKEIDGAIGGLACIDSCFKLRDTCCPFGEDFPVLWTFHYFLCSKETKRICYIACAAVNKARKASLVFYDDEDDDGSDMDLGSDGEEGRRKAAAGDSDEDGW